MHTYVSGPQRLEFELADLALIMGDATVDLESDDPWAAAAEEVGGGLLVVEQDGLAFVAFPEAHDVFRVSVSWDPLGSAPRAAPSEADGWATSEVQFDTTEAVYLMDNEFVALAQLTPSGGRFSGWVGTRKPYDQARRVVDFHISLWTDSKSDSEIA